MYIFIHIFTYIYICIYIHIYTYIYLFIYIEEICKYLCIYISIYLYICIYIHIYTWVHIYILIYIHIYINIYIHISPCGRSTTGFWNSLFSNLQVVIVSMNMNGFGQNFQERFKNIVFQQSISILVIIWPISRFNMSKNEELQKLVWHSHVWCF